MALVVAKKKTKSGGEYYRLMEVKRVRGKVVSRYVAYIGKTPKSKQELAYPDLVVPYLRRLLDAELTDVDLLSVLKKLGIQTDVWPVTKLILENDRKLRRLFLRFK